MDKQTAVAIVDTEYFAYKQDYLYSHYDITQYFTPQREKEGQYFQGKILQPLHTLAEKPEVDTAVVIMAVPLSGVYEKILAWLMSLSISSDHIVTLLGQPYFHQQEGACSLMKGTRFYAHPSGHVVCRIAGKDIRVSSQNELFILYEIFGAQTYAYTFPFENAVLIDVGMNVGMASLFFADSPQISQIYAYEPFIPTFNRALENFNLNPVSKKIKAFPWGLGAEPRKMLLDYSEDNKGDMSTARSNRLYPAAAYEKALVEMVDAARVFSTIKERHPTQPIVLKMDCEGGEYEILERLAETSILPGIQIIIMEWHNLIDKKVDDIERLMLTNGFNYEVIGNRNHARGSLMAERSIS